MFSRLAGCGIAHRASFKRFGGGSGPHMSRLFIVCPGCRRHAFTSERRCPFCATPFSEPARPGVGAALALSTTLLAGACDNNSPAPAAPTPTLQTVPTPPTPPPQVPPTQAPSPPPAMSDAAVVAPVTDASAPPPDLGSVRDARSSRRSTTRRRAQPLSPERHGMDYGIFESPLKMGSAPDEPDDPSRE